MAFSSGQQLNKGNYTIDRQLGKGRFGITYLGRDKKGNPVVIKTISDDLLNQLTPAEIDRLQTKFWQEAVNLARCKHPHIVEVRDTFREGNLVCMAMEYIEGKDLATLTNKIWSEREALNCIRQIGEALKVVHKNKLVHRDIKPANIVVRDSNQEAVLIDFGLALGFDHLLTSVNPTTADGFAALELYHIDAERGSYTDVYSLAATLYFLLTKQIPPSAMERSLAKAKLLPPKEINPQISDKISQAICKGMALAPEERPQSMQEWLDLLGLKSAKIRLPNWKAEVWWAAIGAIAAVIGTWITWITFLKSASPPVENATPTSPPGQIAPNK